MLSQRELTTRFQVETVLQVLGMSVSAMGHYLHSPATDSTVDVPKSPESMIAVENTLRAACERLDSILADTKRWDTTFQDKVEKDYETVHALQMETYAAQRQAAQEVISPHFRYRPSIHRLKDGTWLAFLGNMDAMEYGIMGVGACPQAALQAFDDAFCGIINPTVIKWCQDREQNLEAGTEHTAPFPNPSKNDKESLDSERNGDPGLPSQEERPDAGDCSAA